MKRFGAKGNWDGNTGNDDTNAIISAFNFLISQGGGTLYFPPGNYLLKQSINFDSSINIQIRGAGREVSTISCDDVPFFIGGNGQGSTLIEKLRIRQLALTNTHSCIVIDYPRRCRINDNDIRGFGRDSIHFMSGLHSEMKRNYIFARDSSQTNGHAGIHISRKSSENVATTIITEANYVAAGKQYGYYMDGARFGTSINDIAEYCEVGFRFVQCNLVLTYLYSEQNTRGIELHDSPCTVIKTRGGEPIVTWSGTALDQRNIFLLGSAQDNRLGRDVGIGRLLKIGTSSNEQVGIGIDTPETDLHLRKLSIGDVAITIQNNQYSYDNASASLKFKHRKHDDSQTGDGGSIKSERTLAYNENTSTHRADLVFHTANNDQNIEHTRFIARGGISMKNTLTVPPTPTEGGVFYVENGALKYKGSSGTITTIAPA